MPTFVLENAFFRRELAVDGDGLRTVSVFDKERGREYNRHPRAAEFSFVLDGVQISSYTQSRIDDLDGNRKDEHSDLVLEQGSCADGDDGSRILRLDFHLRCRPLRLCVCYQLYPESRGCIKWLELTADGAELGLSHLVLEMFNLAPGEMADLEFRLGGHRPAPPMFTVVGDEDIVQAYDERSGAGYWVGTTVPGPLRYFMCYPHWPSGLLCGYSRSFAAFHKYLRAGETFVSGKILLELFSGPVAGAEHRNRFRRLIRRVLPACPDHGGIMYCTWLPFLKNIQAGLLGELADCAAELEFKTMVVDDGWFREPAWQVDAEKFPDGLEPLAARLQWLGLRFGLWFNIGTDYGHRGSTPEYFARLLPEGPDKPFSPGLTCRCLASGHRDEITAKLAELAVRYGVDYFKLDFSSIVSPYGIMPAGCAATGHRYHRNSLDAVAEQYAGLLQIRAALKEQHPDLLVDFSFETFGTEVPNIAALQCSELHHASNMTTNNPTTSARKIRHALYRYVLVLPPDRLLGSLICLQGKNDVDNLLTAMVGVPLVAGDLRQIAPAGRHTIRQISHLYHQVIEAGPLTEFFLLNGDPCQALYRWDGFVRLNARGHGGILCLFRNEDPASACTIDGDWLKTNFRLVDLQTGQAAGILSAGQPFTIPFLDNPARGFALFPKSDADRDKNNERI